MTEDEMAGITDSMDVSLSELRELVMDRDKGIDLGVKPSAPSCPPTLPLYQGPPTEQAENQGTLPVGVASVSVEIQIVSIVVAHA